MVQLNVIVFVVVSFYGFEGRPGPVSFFVDFGLNLILILDEVATLDLVQTLEL